MCIITNFRLWTNGCWTLVHLDELFSAFSHVYVLCNTRYWSLAYTTSHFNDCHNTTNSTNAHWCMYIDMRLSTQDGINTMSTEFRQSLSMFCNLCNICVAIHQILLYNLYSTNADIIQCCCITSQRTIMENLSVIRSFLGFLFITFGQVNCE